MATRAPNTTNARRNAATNSRGAAAGSRGRGTSNARRANTATGRRELATPNTGRTAASNAGRTAAMDASRAAAPKAEQTAQREWLNRPVPRAIVAYEQAVQRNSVHVELPVVGVVHLPPADELVFIGGVTGLAIAGLVEWPVALLLGIGHAMATNRHNKLLRSFGDALSEA